eukprot:6214288-Pleurochrysis_carterae.AAC.1
MSKNAHDVLDAMRHTLCTCEDTANDTYKAVQGTCKEMLLDRGYTLTEEAADANDATVRSLE